MCSGCSHTFSIVLKLCKIVMKFQLNIKFVFKEACPTQFSFFFQHKFSLVVILCNHDCFCLVIFTIERLWVFCIVFYDMEVMTTPPRREKETNIFTFRLF